MTSTGDGPAEPIDADTSPEPAWKRRQRLARIFGDAMPDTTSDERGPTGASDSTNDAWLKAQVPPHHG